MSDVEDAHRRVMRSLRLGRAGRLVVVVVHTGVPLVHARIELRGALQQEGFEVVEQDIAEHSDLAAALGSALLGRPHAIPLVYGFEALPQEERRERLRRSSFGRARLQHIPRPFVVLMRDSTWRWVGHELPDLARWADGPVMITGTDDHGRLARLQRVVGTLSSSSPYHDPDEDFSVDLGAYRGTPITRTLLGRVDSNGRPRVLAIAGCPGSGRHHSMRHVLWHLESGETHRGLIRTPQISPVFDQSVSEQGAFVSELRAAIERAPSPVVALFSGGMYSGVEPAFLRCVIEAQSQTDKWVLCSVASQLLFSPDHEELRHRAELVYLAPVAIMHRDGTNSPQAVGALGELLASRLARVGLSLYDVFEPSAFEQLALFSGGLPGLLLRAASGAISVANTDRLHFEVDGLQCVTLTDVEVAVSQLDLGSPPSNPKATLAALRVVDRTGDPASAARVEPYALVYVDRAEVFGGIHPLLSLGFPLIGGFRRATA